MTMAKREERLPFATFALIETDENGILRHQNQIARRKWHYRSGTNLCLQSDLTKSRLDTALDESGYAVATFDSARCEACAVVYRVKEDRLWWLFLEELQQNLLRDTLLCRTDALCSFGQALMTITESKATSEARDDFGELLFAALDAQGAVELVDAKSFLCGLFLPTLQSIGFHTKDTWQNEEMIRPLALAEYAMSLLHITQMFATFAREIDFDLCADEFGIAAILTPRRKYNRKTPAALARHLALDRAFVQNCLQSQSCQIQWETADELTCRVYWCYDCHMANYLGSSTDLIDGCLAQFKRALKAFFSDRHFT
jgi:hypothetical protein